MSYLDQLMMQIKKTMDSIHGFFCFHLYHLFKVNEKTKKCSQNIDIFYEDVYNNTINVVGQSMSLLLKEKL